VRLATFLCQSARGISAASRVNQIALFSSAGHAERLRVE
jgi:hypothetical protein